MDVCDWADIGGVLIVPTARAAAICRQYSSEYEQRTQVAIYFVNCRINASWSDLGGKLYRGNESAAIDTFISQLPKQKGD